MQQLVAVQPEEVALREVGQLEVHFPAGRVLGQLACTGLGLLPVRG